VIAATAESLLDINWELVLQLTDTVQAEGPQT